MTLDYFKSHNKWALQTIKCGCSNYPLQNSLLQLITALLNLAKAKCLLSKIYLLLVFLPPYLKRITDLAVY